MSCPTAEGALPRPGRATDEASEASISRARSRALSSVGKRRKIRLPVVSFAITR